MEEFWACYKEWEPGLEIFDHEFWDASTLVPLYVHGDGGRTYRRDELMIFQYQPLLGLGTRKSHPLGLLRNRKPGANMQGHSFTTRFLFGVMQKPLYKDDPDLFQNFLLKMMENFADLYYRGLQLGDCKFRFIVIGIKGDLPFLSKAGNLTRTFLHIRKAPANEKSKPLGGCCWLCGAGTDELPFEDFSRSPRWLLSCGSANVCPWNRCPMFFEPTPHVRADPGSFFKLDVLHIYHLGMGRDFAGSSLVSLLDLYGANSVEAAIEAMNADLKAFLQASRKQLHFKQLTRDLLGYASARAFPTGHWAKAMDTPVMVEFVLWRLARDARQVSEDRLLQIIQSGAQAIGMCMRGMLQANLWMEFEQARVVAESGLYFLQCYGKCANICHSREICRFNLTPKLHCWHHICQHLWHQTQQQIRYSLNPLAHSCFTDEDFVGRVSRISRRVSPRLQALRTLQRYLALTKQELDAAD